MPLLLLVRPPSFLRPPVLPPPSPSATGEPFNLLYAPHFGMFKESAGEDFVDQIKFMYDAGFRAMEDNGMKGRSVDGPGKNCLGHGKAWV